MLWTRCIEILTRKLRAACNFINDTAFDFVTVLGLRFGQLHYVRRKPILGELARVIDVVERGTGGRVRLGIVHKKSLIPCGGTTAVRVCVGDGSTLLVGRATENPYDCVVRSLGRIRTETIESEEMYILGELGEGGTFWCVDATGDLEPFKLFDLPPFRTAKELEMKLGLGGGLRTYRYIGGNQ